MRFRPTSALPQFPHRGAESHPGCVSAHISRWALLAVQGHCWKSRTGALPPSLFSKPSPPVPLQPRREVFASSLIPPGKAIRVQPWGSAQPIWSLLWHLQPIRYETLKNQHHRDGESLSCPQALPCVSARLPRCHPHPIPTRDLLYQVDLSVRVWFPRDFTSM